MNFVQKSIINLTLPAALEQASRTKVQLGLHRLASKASFPIDFRIRGNGNEIHPAVAHRLQADGPPHNLPGFAFF